MKQLPTWARILIIAIIALGVIYATYRFVSSFLDSIHQLELLRGENSLLRGDLESAGEEVAFLRRSLLEAGEENRRLIDSLTSSQRQLTVLRERISESLSIVGDVEGENSGLLGEIRACIQLVSQLKEALREFGKGNS